MSMLDERRLELPPMRMVHQRFETLPAVDPAEGFQAAWEQCRRRLPLRPDLRVAVCVGSRGIANLPILVREVVSRLKAEGCRPFVTPAMGSHGGATAQGQLAVLQARGITQEAVGAPLEATMEVVPMGETDGIPLFLDRLAHEADGIVLINRIKPHTNFVGPTESGLIKMMAIGLGNAVGAEHYHRLSVVRPQYEVISTAGKSLIQRSRVLFGVGVVENGDHETALVRIAPAEEVEAMEIELLKEARRTLATLPVEEVDLLIVDEMGKNISGEGIDPNVVGRDVCAYGTRRPLPQITRIFVRDLTEATEGTATGIGQADFTLQRLVNKMDIHATTINSLIACCPEGGKIPLTFPNDRQALAAALMTLRPYTLEDLRLVHIKNTLELSRVLVSVGCLPQLEGREHVSLEPEEHFFAFDSEGFLISPFEARDSAP